MSDLKSEIGSDAETSYSINANTDPKNVQELTVYVSIMRQRLGRWLCPASKVAFEH